jgi:curved DNA-binding protein CbpA
MSQMTIDPYATLGVPRDASDQLVRSAYRRLAKRYHPDLHPGAQSAEQMRRVNEAWEILSSPLRRARYDADAALRAARPAGHWAVPERRSAAAATEARRWETGWAAPPTGRTTWQPRAGVPFDSDEDGPRWPGALLAIVIVLLGFAGLVAGILPPPLLAISVFLAARLIVGRLD